MKVPALKARCKSHVPPLQVGGTKSALVERLLLAGDDGTHDWASGRDRGGGGARTATGVSGGGGGGGSALQRLTLLELEALKLRCSQRHLADGGRKEELIARLLMAGDDGVGVVGGGERGRGGGAASSARGRGRGRGDRAPVGAARRGSRPEGIRTGDGVLGGDEGSVATGTGSEAAAAAGGHGGGDAVAAAAAGGLSGGYAACPGGTSPGTSPGARGRGRDGGRGRSGGQGGGKGGMSAADAELQRAANENRATLVLLGLPTLGGSASSSPPAWLLAAIRKTRLQPRARVVDFLLRQPGSDRPVSAALGNWLTSVAVSAFDALAPTCSF